MKGHLKLLEQRGERERAAGIYSVTDGSKKVGKNEERHLITLTMPSPKDAINQNGSRPVQNYTDDARGNSLLQLFIKHAWKDIYGECSIDEAKKFRESVSFKNIDFSNKNWPSLLQQPINNRDCYYSKNWCMNPFPDIFHELAYKLKQFLPILFNCNGNVNFVDEEGRTILHVFLASIESKSRSSKSEHLKDTKLLKNLIEQGASVNIADKRGQTPFHIAATLGQKENLQIMLENFTSIDIHDEHGNTALHTIVANSLTLDGEHEKSYAEIVQSLLFKGADCSSKNKEGLTPVQLAASRYNLEILQIFKANGADFKVLTDNGENLVLLACKNKWRVKDESKVTKTIDFLVNQGCDVNLTDDHGNSPLHYASLWDRSVKNLIKLGAIVDVRTKSHQQTPLHWALKGYHSNIEVIEALVTAGANVNAKAADGSSPLLMAVMRSSPDIACFLVDQGAKVHDKDDVFGFTPLHLSAFDKEKFALFEDFDVNVRSNHGLTPLHLASLASNVEVMKTLIGRGANVECRDDSYQTPLHMVLLGNFFLNLEPLLGRSIDENLKKVSFVEEMWSSLWCRYSHRQRDAIEFLVKNAAADVNVTDANGRRPLHLATRESLGNSIEMLLKLGAQVDVIDHEGRLPFHGVLENGNATGLKHLLNFGLDVNDKDSSRLVISSKKDVKEVVFWHLLKLKAAGLPIANVYKSQMSKAKYRREFSRYSNEVKRMKNHLIDDSSVSLYAFLHMNWKRRLTLIPCEYTYAYGEFEVYQKIIQSSCREALERKRLLGMAVDAWYRITKYHLPDICVEHVFQYLSNRYLTALIDSAELNCDDKSA